MNTSKEQCVIHSTFVLQISPCRCKRRSATTAMQTQTQHQEEQPLPHVLLELYGAECVHTVEEGLLKIVDTVGHAAVLRSALHTAGDSPDYSETLLRRTFLVWPASAPRLPATSSLLQHSTQSEVVLDHTAHSDLS